MLAVRGFARTESQVAIDRLQEEGYLNDRRFATAWARSRLQTKPMGPHRLSKELETKGVEAQLVREILEEVYEEGEEPAARRAMAGKLSALGRLSAPSRTLSVARFLHRRGFSADIIWRLLHDEQQE
ncbi:MAG: RecX family transcriptional regulator [candidate division NC10 bacterium]|nr:RecX family transcriptional regulator [candidate division NC10 bacterium]MDE2322185.1 RecX family transcriptional regulator [candidate division NC10 bacterium]